MKKKNPGGRQGISRCVESTATILALPLPEKTHNRAEWLRLIRAVRRPEDDALIAQQLALIANYRGRAAQVVPL